jgi:hypothetical protein
VHWLELAKRGLKYKKAAKGVQEAARRAKCDLCSRHEGVCGPLRIDLATAGRFDPLAFDAKCFGRFIEKYIFEGRSCTEYVWGYSATAD